MALKSIVDAAGLAHCLLPQARQLFKGIHAGHNRDQFLSASLVHQELYMSDGSLPPASLGKDMHGLYRDHSQWLRGWIRRRLGDSERAADLTQDTFVRLISSALTRVPKEPRTYLATVAKRLMIDQLRSVP